MIKIEEFLTKAEEFEKTKRAEIKKAWKRLEDFLKLFPFRDYPEKIDELTPEKIYTRGDKNAFLYWPEFGLKDLGYISGHSAYYAENARDNAEVFRELLKIVVNDSLSLSKKLDASWEDIKFFGGDKTIAKKIIFCYYPKEVLPIYKTDDLEHFANILKLNFKKEAYNYGKPYDMLSVGEQFELLNNLLLRYKNIISEFKNWDNLVFMNFLCEYFPPQRIRIKARELKPLHSLGILFEPKYEQEVVYLFSVFHKELGFPYIIEIRNNFPDATVMNEEREVKRIEFEVRSSDFKHPKKGCDFIVCWEDDLETSEDLPTIIALKDFIEELK